MAGKLPDRKDLATCSPSDATGLARTRRTCDIAHEPFGPALLYATMCVTIKPSERMRACSPSAATSQARGLSPHGEGRRVHRRQHVPVLHAQPARRPCEGHRPERHRGLCRLCARAWHRAHPGARALHAEPRLRQAADARFRAHGAGRGPRPYGGDAASAVQHASRQRCRPAVRGCHRQDRRRAEPEPAAASDHHVAIGDDGGERQRDRRHVRGAGGHHRAGGLESHVGVCLDTCHVWDAGATSWATSTACWRSSTV